MEVTFYDLTCITQAWSQTPVTFSHFAHGHEKDESCLYLKGQQVTDSFVTLFSHLPNWMKSATSRKRKWSGDKIAFPGIKNGIARQNQWHSMKLWQSPWVRRWLLSPLDLYWTQSPFPSTQRHTERQQLHPSPSLPRMLWRDHFKTSPPRSCQEESYEVECDEAGS